MNDVYLDQWSGREQEWAAYAGMSHASSVGPLESLDQGNHCQLRAYVQRKWLHLLRAPSRQKSFVFLFVHSIHEWARLDCQLSPRSLASDCILANRIRPSSMSHGRQGYCRQCEYQRQRCCDGLTTGRLCHVGSTLSLKSGHILAKPDSDKEA